MAPQTYEAGASAGNGSADAQEQFSWMAANAKAQASEAIRPLKESARKIAQDQKNTFADRLGGFAKTMDNVAEQSAQDSPAVREMLSAAAGSIRGASDSLRQHHIDDITEAAQHFARNRPVALFAGAIVAGFALSRFLKSSLPEQGGRGPR